MKLKFKATKGFLYHNGPYGVIRDGEIKDYPDKEAQRLLKDFPKNFDIVKGKAVEKQPDKMIKDAKTKKK
ncbi:MAG: hypothetical protein GXO75_16200 [Calditrichaeota bacterium]|nr:hypothetical protein [Calditrichota bacterium]